MLEVGQKIPEFKLTNESGAEVSSKSLKGKKYILYFYPKDDTPGCTKEACGFRDFNADFKKKGYVIFGVSKDDEVSHQKFKQKYKLPFALLVDDELKLAKATGAYGEKNMYGKKSFGIIRSTFVIDEQGMIQKVYKVRDAGEHPEKLLADL